MRGWREVTLGELLRIKHGFAFKGEFFSDSGDTILLTPGNFRAEGGLKLKGEREKYYSGPIPEEFVLRKNDLLVAMTDLTQNAPILGSAAVVKESNRFLHNQRLGKIVDLNTTVSSPAFVYYLFNSPSVRAQIRATATGATVKHTAPDRIYRVRVQLPPLAEQERLAGVLSAYDDLIENCERRICVLDEMARALYREWFVLVRYPGHENTRLVNTEFGRIPVDWEIASVGEVCARVTDGAHASPRSVTDGVPMASSKDMTDWGLNLATARQISQHDFDELVRNGCKPEIGDVLVTKDGANYLKRIIVLRDELNVVLLSSIAILRCNGRIRPSLLAAALKSPENLNRLKNCVTGAAIPRIVLKDFKAFRLVLPSSEVQLAWSKVGEPLQELCWMLSAQVASLAKTRNLLLPRLLSGEVDIADAA